MSAKIPAEARSAGAEFPRRNSTEAFPVGGRRARVIQLRTMVMSRCSLDDMLAAVPLDAFGSGIHFAVVDDALAPPPGYEGAWSTFKSVGDFEAHPWSDKGALAAMAAVVVITSLPNESQRQILSAFDRHLQDHPFDAPPVLLLPLPGAEASALHAWISDHVRSAAIDGVIRGAPSGYALALAVRAAMQDCVSGLDSLQDEVFLRTSMAESKACILSSVNHMRWDYLRSRVFHEIPRTREDTEAGGLVAGYSLGHEITRGLLGVLRVAKRQQVDEAGPACSGMLVLSKRSGVRSLNDMRRIHNFLTILGGLSRAPHPNISRMLNAFAGAESLYTHMELAGPRTLFSRLCIRDAPLRGATPLPFTAPGLRSVMLQVCVAVCHLHIVASVCHRDIKPENISVREWADGRIETKLFGFELARVQLEGERCTHACGTAPFIAPEVALRSGSRQQGYDGKAADMWSLGVLLVEAACGLRAFERALSSPGQGSQARQQTPREFASRVRDVFGSESDGFVPGLLKGAACEAAASKTWLESVLVGLLKISPQERFAAEVLQTKTSELLSE